MNTVIPENVYHKEYGDGEVIKITGDKIYVSFNGKKRIFTYPDAVTKGYLSVVKSLSGNTELDDAEVLLEEDIKQTILIVKINKYYENGMNPDALYNSVRGVWRASKERVQQAEYVFGVYKSLVVAVYKPTKWFTCKEAPENLPRPDIELTEKTENRVFFEDKSYEQGLPPDENQQFYLGKSIANFTMVKSAQNPISYLYPL